MGSRSGKSAGLRGLVLGGAVATLSMLNSGCWLVAVTVPAYLSQSKANADRQAQAQVEAARIQAEAIRGASNNQRNYGGGGNGGSSVYGVSQTERDISMYGSVGNYRNHRHILFAFKNWNDLDGKGVSPEEAFGISNSFFKSENIFVYSNGGNPFGVHLAGERPRLYTYAVINADTGNAVEKKYFEGSIDKIFTYPSGTFSPGNYRILCGVQGEGIFNSLNLSIKD